MLSSARTQRWRNSTVSVLSVPRRTRSVGSRRCLENLRIVTSGPDSDSGGMIALTRLPSGRRASTIGEDSSMRRPTWATILLMMRRRCDSSVKRAGVWLQPAAALDPDVVRAVDHDLGHGVVGQQPLERPVAEDVVGDLADQPLAVGAGQAALELELARMSASTRARSATGFISVLNSCGPELADDARGGSGS